MFDNISLVIRQDAFLKEKTGQLLHEVLPPGGKMYQAGFATFSSTDVKLCDFEVGFIGSSKLYDWRGIQIGKRSNFNHTKVHVHFSDLRRPTTFYMQSCRLVARHTKLALRNFLAQWLFYPTLKSV